VPTPQDLTLEEVAARLGWSVRTLHSRIRDGQAPPSYVLGRRRLFPKRAFTAWLAEQRAAAR
jgi:excisionase family DNA binding protein